MESTYYLITTYWVILVNIIMAIAMIALYKTGKASSTTLIIVGALLLGLIAVMHWGFGGQNFLSPQITGSAFYAIILGGAGAGVLLFYVTSKDVFDNLSQEHIQLVQGLRVFIGAGFLMEGALGVIPVWFSIMDAFFHITSGFLALVAAIAFLKNYPMKTPLLWSANIIGLLDIVTIVTSICFVVWADLGPHHNMNYVVFGVGPVLLWLHFMSVRKLLKA